MPTGTAALAVAVSPLFGAASCAPALSVDSVRAAARGRQVLVFESLVIRLAVVTMAVAERCRIG
jgi:hypothetical protein